MNINELRKVTDEILKNFVNQLGLDGEAYVSMNTCPMIYGNLEDLELLLDGRLAGKFFTPKSNELKGFLKYSPLSQEDKQKYFEDGLIVINSTIFKHRPADKLLLITAVHERLHSGRAILTELPYSGDEEIENYFYDEGRFVKNSEEKQESYVDPAQEVLLSSIDQSKSVVDHYNKLSFNEKDDLQFANYELGIKMDKQKEIDEALIDLMAITAYILSTGKFSNIMDAIDYISKNYKDNDEIHTNTIRAMANIVLRHNDLELFKWMLDPITYQVDDIHYDYFAHYTNSDDADDIDTIFEGITNYDDFIDDEFHK